MIDNRLHAENMSKSDGMTSGYLDGFSGLGVFPGMVGCTAYMHGYQNGQADRGGKARDRADVLKRRAAMILGDES